MLARTGRTLISKKSEMKREVCARSGTTNVRAASRVKTQRIDRFDPQFHADGLQACPVKEKSFGCWLLTGSHAPTEPDAPTRARRALTRPNYLGCILPPFISFVNSGCGLSMWRTHSCVPCRRSCRHVFVAVAKPEGARACSVCFACDSPCSPTPNPSILVGTTATRPPSP